MFDYILNSSHNVYLKLFMTIMIIWWATWYTFGRTADIWYEQDQANRCESQSSTTGSDARTILMYYPHKWYVTRSTDDCISLLWEDKWQNEWWLNITGDSQAVRSILDRSIEHCRESWNCETYDHQENWSWHQENDSQSVWIWWTKYGRPIIENPTRISPDTSTGTSAKTVIVNQPVEQDNSESGWLNNWKINVCDFDPSYTPDFSNLKKPWEYWWQCWKYINQAFDNYGKWKWLQNTIEQKKTLINASYPVPWAVAIIETWWTYGHVAIVVEVNKSEWLMLLNDSNSWWDEIVDEYWVWYKVNDFPEWKNWKIAWYYIPYTHYFHWIVNQSWEYTLFRDAEQWEEIVIWLVWNVKEPTKEQLTKTRQLVKTMWVPAYEKQDEFCTNGFHSWMLSEEYIEEMNKPKNVASRTNVRLTHFKPSQWWINCWWWWCGHFADWTPVNSVATKSSIACPYPYWVLDDYRCMVNGTKCPRNPRLWRTFHVEWVGDVVCRDVWWLIAQAWQINSRWQVQQETKFDLYIWPWDHTNITRTNIYLK